MSAGKKLDPAAFVKRMGWEGDVEDGATRKEAPPPVPQQRLDPAAFVKRMGWEGDVALEPPGPAGAGDAAAVAGTPPPGAAPKPTLSTGESIRLRHVARTGRRGDAAGDAVLGALSLGIIPVLDAASAKNLGEFATGELSTMAGKKPLSRLVEESPDWLVSQRAREAGLWGIEGNKGRYDSFLAENKGRFKDRAVRGREVAGFLQGMARDEQEKRAAAKADAQRRLGESGERWYTTGMRVGVDLTGFAGRVMTGPAGFIAGEGGRRTLELSTDDVALDDQGSFVDVEGDSVGKAAAKGVAGGAIEYGLVKGTGKALSWLVGKAAGTALGRKIGETKVGNFLRNMDVFAKATGVNHAPAMAAMMMAQTLVDEGAGLALRGPEKEGTTLGGRSREAMARFFSGDSLAELGWMMALGSASAMGFSAVRSAYGNRSVDGHLRALGIGQKTANAYTPEQKWAVLEKVFDDYSPERAREDLAKVDKRCATLYDEIMSREGADFRALMAEIKPDFEMPTETGPDGKPQVAWQHDGMRGKRFIEDEKSGVSVWDNGDGSMEVEGGGRAFYAKDANMAFTMARQLSRVLRVEEYQRGQRKAYLENAAGRLAGDMRFEAFDTEEQFLRRHGEMTGRMGPKGETRAVTLADGSRAVILDNVRSPAEMLRVVLDPGVETLVKGLLDNPKLSGQFFHETFGRLPREAREAVLRGALGTQARGGDGKEYAGKFLADVVFAGREANPTVFDRAVSFVRNQVRRVKPGLPLNGADMEVLMEAVQESRRGDKGWVSYEATEEQPGNVRQARRPPADHFRDTAKKAAGDAPAEEAVPPASEVRPPADAGAEPPKPDAPREAENPPRGAPGEAAPAKGTGEAAKGAEGKQGALFDDVAAADGNQPPPDSGPLGKLLRQLPVERVPLDSLEVNARELPQFKEDADPGTGEVAGQELTGRFFPMASNPIVVYRKNDGRTFVVTGRHRVGLHRRNGLPEVDARVMKESEWTLEDAARVDALSNIIDEKGTVHDYVTFLDNAGLSRRDAEEWSILSRPKGRAAWSIHEGAGEDLKSAIDWTGQNGGIRPEQAALIAENAPVKGDAANAGIQRLAMQKAVRGMPTREIAPYVQAMVRAAQNMRKGERYDEGDIFAGTQWARGAVENEAEIEAREIAKRVAEYERLRAILSQAAKKPKSLVLTEEQAAALGISDRTDAEQLRKAWERVNTLAAEWASPAISRERINEARVSGGLAPLDYGETKEVKKESHGGQGEDTSRDAVHSSGQEAAGRGGERPEEGGGVAVTGGGTGDGRSAGQVGGAQRVVQGERRAGDAGGTHRELPADPAVDAGGKVGRGVTGPAAASSQDAPSPAPQPSSGAPQVEPSAFGLESATQGEIDAEQKRRADKERIENGLARTLKDDGRTAAEFSNAQLDLGGDAAPADLFGHAAVQRDRQETETPPEPAAKQVAAGDGGEAETDALRHSPIRQAAGIMAKKKVWVARSDGSTSNFTTFLAGTKTEALSSARLYSRQWEAPPFDEVFSIGEAATADEAKAVTDKWLADELKARERAGGVQKTAPEAEAPGRQEEKTATAPQPGETPQQEGAQEAPEPSGPENKPPRNDGQRNHLIAIAADKMAEHLKKGPLSRAQAAQIMAGVFGGSEAKGTFSSKDTTDVAELAVNMLVKGDKDFNPDVDGAGARRAVAKLNGIVSRIPSQTTRTGEMEAMQQFSTPPPLAYVVNWAAGVDASDVAFEPSAGIGGIAVFAHNAGARVELNELSPRRAEILRELDIADDITQEDAENIHAILEPRIRDGAFIRPTVIVMNPPFSASVASGKTGDTKIGAKHIESALKLLAGGGRLVAVVGNGMAAGKPAFSEWWRRIGNEYTVRANVGVSGKDYRKHGTVFDNQVVVIDKVKPAGQAKPVTGSAGNAADLIGLLEGVRNEREHNIGEGLGRGPVNRGAEQASAERGGPGSAEKGKPALERERGHGDVPASTGAERDSGVDGGRGRLDSGGRKPVRGNRDSEPPEDDSGGRGGTVGRGENTGHPSDGSGGNGVVPAEPGVSGNIGKSDSAAGLGGVENLSRLINVEQRSDDTHEISDSTFTSYTPRKVRIKGARPHPTPLVESSAMASVEPPDPTYAPALEEHIVNNGDLTLPQLEAVIYAGQSFEQKTPDNKRMGYFIGDGTGVGKGRQIAGIIRDNWNRGRQKAVWVSVKQNLIGDARRDLDALGLKDTIIDLYPKGGKNALKAKTGVGFVTYSSLASGHKGLDPDTKRARSGLKKGEMSRFQVLEQWLGKDFDGVIAFDEAHTAGNAVPRNGPRGKINPSLNALAVVDLQAAFPDARILYVSATGATEVSNLSFGDRLGIWGPGTPFPTKGDFFGKIKAGGMSAMEIVARDLKAQGRYLARTLSFDGVESKRITHALTPDQTRKYNEASGAWQTIFSNIDMMMSKTGASNDTWTRASFVSNYVGAMQRFYNQLLTAMQMPSVIRDAKEAIARGESVVFQLVATNEAAQSREFAKQAGDEDATLDDIDLSPMNILLNYVNSSYPTTQFIEKEDPDNPDKPKWEALKDSKGNLVENPEAVRAKQELLDKLSRMRMPENPLEIILDTFGHQNVAEITGRKTRLVSKPDEHGNIVTQKETGRSNATLQTEADEFTGGKRRVLVFSTKGGTGFSYHAGLKFKNQQRRNHYILQSGWRADAAIQGIGRTHRSDQASAPRIVLASTNMKGQQRFISTIARRLSQLGSLTSGDRAASGGNMFTEADNLENAYTEDAVQKLFMDMYANALPGFKLEDMSKKMGWSKTVISEDGGRKVISTLINEDGTLNMKRVPNVASFLNRVLLLDVGEQDRLFEVFMGIVDRNIQAAKDSGHYDPGLQTLHAHEIRKVSDELVWEQPGTGAKTRIVTVDVDRELRRVPFRGIEDRIAGKNAAFGVNKRSGNVHAFIKLADAQDEDGKVVPMWRRVSPSGAEETVRESDIWKSYDIELRVTDKGRMASIEKAWDRDYKKASPMRTTQEAYIVGAFLPIWDRIGDNSPRIFRVTPKGEGTFLGALIPKDRVAGVRKRLGAGQGDTVLRPAQIFTALLNGEKFELANDWQVRRSRVNNEDRIEVVGIESVAEEKEFVRFIGGFTEKIGFTTRFFIPTDERAGLPALERLIVKAPVVNDSNGDLNDRTERYGDRPAETPPRLMEHGIGEYGEKPSGDEKTGILSRRYTKRASQRYARETGMPADGERLVARQLEFVFSNRDDFAKAFGNPDNPEAWNRAFSAGQGTVSRILHDFFTDGTGHHFPRTFNGQPLAGLKVKSMSDVAALLMPLRNPYQESMKAIFLDNNNRILDAQVVSIGILDTSLVHPREMFKRGIKLGAKKVIFSHNHPSGDPSPSEEDGDITDRLKKAGEILGIECVDHLITNGKSYHSLAEGATLPFDGDVPIWEAYEGGKALAVREPKVASRFVGILRQGGGGCIHSIALDTKMRITAVSRIPFDPVRLDDGGYVRESLLGSVFRAVMDNPSASIILDLADEGITPEQARAIHDAAKAAEKTIGIPISDSIYNSGGWARSIAAGDKYKPLMPLSAQAAEVREAAGTETRLHRTDTGLSKDGQIPSILKEDGERYGGQADRYMERNGISPGNAGEAGGEIAKANENAKAAGSGEAAYYPVDSAQPPRAEQIRRLFNGELPPGEAQELFDGGNIVSRLILDNIQSGVPFDVKGATVSSVEDAVSLLLPLRSPFFESTKVMYLDAGGKVLESQILAVGAQNEVRTDFGAVFTDMPEGTRKIIFAHNHPSGDPEPTWRDTAATDKLKNMCASHNVELGDHIITDGKRFYSFEKGETLDIPNAKPAGWELFDAGEQQQPLKEPAKIRDLADTLRNGNTDNSHVIYLDNRLGIIAIQRVEDPINLLQETARNVKAYGAMQVIIDAGGPLRHRPMTLPMELVRPLSERGIRIADVLAGDRSLYREYGDMMADWWDVADQYAKRPEGETPKGTSGAYEPESGVYRGTHAEIDARREQRGLESLVSGHRVSNWKAVTDARAELERDRDAGQKLVSRMKTSPKALAPGERAVLMVEYVRANVMLERAQTAAATAADSGDTEALEQAKADAAAWGEMLDNIEEALHNGGSEAGRALQACKIALREDYSLAGMRRKLRAAQDFAPLTREQEKFIEDNNRRRDAAEEKLNARIAELEEEKRLLREALLCKQAMNRMLMQKKAADPAKLMQRAKKSLRNESLANSGYVGEDFLEAFITKMAKSYIATGERDAASLVSRITAVINSIIPELGITERRVAELFSKYGQVSFPSEDEISRTLADLKQQQLKMLAIEDILNQIAPKRTGYQRGEPSAEVRELTRRLHRLMKEAGIQARDRETQLKSALDAIKTRLKNQIEDMELAIQRGERITKSDGVGIVYDEEATTLKQKRDAAKAVYDEVFPPEPLTDEQALKRLIGIASRTLAKWQERVERLKNKEPEPVRRKTTLTNAELEGIRDGIEYLKDYAQRLKDLANPKLSPEELEYRNYKRQLERAIANREQRIADSDFGPRKRKDREKLIFGNKELFTLWKERQTLDRDFRRKAEEARRKKQGPGAKAFHLAIQQNALLRTTLAAMDLTVGIIQGGLVLRRHPAIWAKSLKAAVTAICSERDAQAAYSGIEDSPDYYWIRRSGIRIRQLDEEGPLTRAEEALCRGLHRVANIEKWTRPIRAVDHAYKAANHGHVTFLNTARVAMLRNYAKARGGYDKLDSGELRDIGKVINILSGSADFDDKAVNRIIGNRDLNNLYFALPYAVSRLQAAAHSPLFVKNRHARRYVQSHYAALYGTTIIASALLTLLLAGLVKDDGDDRDTLERALGRLRTEFQLDPRAADFLRIPVNDTGDRKINLLPGLQQSAVLLARLAMWSYKDKYGDVHSYGDPDARRSALDDIVRFNRNKLAPVPAFIYSALSGRAHDGRRFRLGSELPKMIFGMPISANTAVSNWDTQHHAASAAIALMVMLGVGYTVTTPTDYNGAVADFKHWSQKLKDPDIPPSTIRDIYRKAPYMHREGEIRPDINAIERMEAEMKGLRQGGHDTRLLETEIELTKRAVLERITGVR